MNEIWSPSYPHQSFTFIPSLLEATHFSFAFVSQSNTFFLSKNEVLGGRKATPSHNQHFHSTANPRQPEGCQHKSASAAAAAVWESVTAGCVGLSISLRPGQSWCDVCVILGRWHVQLSVLKAYANASLDWCAYSFFPWFTGVSRLSLTLPLDTAMLIFPPWFDMNCLCRQKQVCCGPLWICLMPAKSRFSVCRAEHPWTQAIILTCSHLHWEFLFYVPKSEFISPNIPSCCCDSPFFDGSISGRLWIFFHSSMTPSCPHKAAKIRSEWT